MRGPKHDPQHMKRQPKIPHSTQDRIGERRGGQGPTSCPWWMPVILPCKAGGSTTKALSPVSEVGASLGSCGV